MNTARRHEPSKPGDFQRDRIDAPHTPSPQPSSRRAQHPFPAFGAANADMAAAISRAGARLSSIERRWGDRRAL